MWIWFDINVFQHNVFSQQDNRLYHIDVNKGSTCSSNKYSHFLFSTFKYILFELVL